MLFETFSSEFALSIHKATELLYQTNLQTIYIRDVSFEIFYHFRHTLSDPSRASFSRTFLLYKSIRNSVQPMQRL